MRSCSPSTHLLFPASVAANAARYRRKEATIPTRILHFIHDSVVAPAVPPVLGAAFSTADVHVHDLQAQLVEFQKNNRNFQGIVEGLHVRVSNLGAATKLTIRICADPEGDFTLVPDTEATLVPGLTTATTACVAFKIQIPLFQIIGGPGNGNLYVFAKVDAGTPNFAQSCLTWME